MSRHKLRPPTNRWKLTQALAGLANANDGGNGREYWGERVDFLVHRIAEVGEDAREQHAELFEAWRKTREAA